MVNKKNSFSQITQISQKLHRDYRDPEYTDFRKSVYKLLQYLNTSKRKVILLSTQEDDNETALNMILPTKIRWTSFYCAIDRILIRYSSIVTSLKKFMKDKDHGAKGFENLLKDFEDINHTLGSIFKTKLP